VKKIRKPSSENGRNFEIRNPNFVLRQSLDLIRPVVELRIAERLPTILPLPKGEGRGEGEGRVRITNRFHPNQRFMERRRLRRSGSRSQYASKNENALHEPDGGISLSLRERVGVRGKGAFESPTAFVRTNGSRKAGPCVLQVHGPNAHRKESRGSS